jgi:putative membrane protein insertion efficiency factor
MRILWWILLTPRNISLGFLWLYRKLISPLYGPVCRYYPSCSAYAVQAIQYHGAAWGVALTSWRILRCNPWSRGGIDDPPNRLRPQYVVTSQGFVKPRKAEATSGSH